MEAKRYIFEPSLNKRYPNPPEQIDLVEMKVRLINQVRIRINQELP
jgi:hypothetical protein